MSIGYFLTEDGSYTLYNSELDECYHSNRGAITESEHVFINAGLKSIDKKQINVLEVGFGTGLNALLTLLYAKNNNLNVFYEAIEAYPLTSDLYLKLNYEEFLNTGTTYLKCLHEAKMNIVENISSDFRLLKIQSFLQTYTTNNTFDVIYFDAFSANVQPELWTSEIFGKLYSSLNPNGILVTYASKGIVKQALRDVGFHVKRLAGANGKRHMLRAEK